MEFKKCLQFQLSGNLKEAEKCYRNLLNKNKNLPDVLCNLGIICAKTNREEEAIKLFNDTIELDQKSFIAYNNLGLIYSKKENFDKAINNFSIALKYNKHSQTYFNLAIIYEKKDKIKEAIKTYQASFIADPTNSGALCNLGNLFYILGELDNAKIYLEKAIKYKPYLDASLNNLGLVNMAFGNINNAKNNFLKAIKINPNNSKSHYNLCNLTSYNEGGKRHVDQMILNLNSSKSNDEKKHYFFSLGKVYEDKKNYKTSFDYFKKGNNICRNNFKYSISDDNTLYKNIKKIYNHQSLSNLNYVGFNESMPIFIIGMPRSGTSLVEQILSSHPEVFGAGEINDLENIILEFFSQNNKIRSLKNISEIDHQIFKIAGQKYCMKIRKRSNRFNFVTNKLTLNFRWIGLIKLILPNAKIIHCKRHPADTCFSIFKRLFPINGNEYTFDLKEIGHYYNLYADLMIYWKKLLPDTFYDVFYENLINDNKNQIKTILDYCNLEWHDNCLNFQKTKRVVKTSSDSQVRKKIYKTSLNKWELYKDHLSDLLNILSSNPNLKNYKFN